MGEKGNQQRRLTSVAVCMQVGTHLPVYLMQQNTSAVAPCTPSVRCDPQYAQVAASVVAIYVVNIPTRTVGLCSGLASSTALGFQKCVVTHVAPFMPMVVLQVAGNWEVLPSRPSLAADGITEV